ncbi:glycoside hydrolase family protein, partial [Rhizophagus irregularis]
LSKKFEVFKENFYDDPVGITTIGYGHNCKANKDSDKIKAPISIKEAEELLRKDLVKFEDYVNKQVPELNSNQFSAVVSFAYNLGCDKLRTSILLKKLKAGDTQGASEEFGRWVHAKRKRLPGLVRRREDERQLFLKK